MLAVIWSTENPYFKNVMSLHLKQTFGSLRMYSCASLTVKKDVPQKRTHAARTNPSWACSVRMHSRLVRFHTFN